MTPIAEGTQRSKVKRETYDILSEMYCLAATPTRPALLLSTRQVKDEDKLSIPGSKRPMVDILGAGNDSGNINDAGGDVQLAEKPAMDVHLEPPAKRVKPDEAADEGGGSGDVEMVGSAGSVVFPHNRFSCPEVCVCVFVLFVVRTCVSVPETGPDLMVRCIIKLMAFIPLHLLGITPIT